MKNKGKNCVDVAVKKGVPRDKAEGMRDYITAAKQEKWEQRVKELKDKAAKQAKAAEKRAEVNVNRRVNAAIHIAKAPDAVLGLESLLIGTNTPFEGSRMSAEAAILGYKAEFIGNFRRDLGDDQAPFASRKFERDWVRELFALNAKGPAGVAAEGGKGVTGNPTAFRIATAIKKLQKRSVDAQNRNGADIGELNNYITRTEHASERLEKMGREAWIKLVRNTADLEKTFGADRAGEWDELLGTMYERLRLGRFEDFDAEEDRFVVATQNVAKAASQSRVLQFSTPDGWYDYALAAGETPVTDRVLSSAMKAARNAGLMSVLGTNPADNFARIFGRVIENIGDLGQQNALNAAEERLKRWIGIMTGDSGRITNKGRALAVQNWMTLQRVAKLGMLPFSQVADLSTIMSELRYQGVDIPSRLLGPLSGYFQGKGSQQREVASLLGGAVDGWISEISAHMDQYDPQLGGGPVTGALSSTQNWMFKWSGASAMTNRARENSLYLMAKHFGAKRGAAYDSLNASEVRIMKAFEIGEGEWNVLGKGEWTNVQGDFFLTPHIVESIPDADMLQWAASAGRSKMTAEDARHVLATRLWRYYSDREKYAVLDIGVRERSIITQGTASDTGLGIALRVAMQFKSFMVAQISRTWGRELYGQDGLGAVSGLIQFAVAATVLGTVGEMMRDIAKGNDPFHAFHENPGGYLGKGAVRGGAGAILGDFLMSEYTRHGQRFSGYALGPTGGVIDELLMIKSQVGAGENAAPSILNLAKSNLPLQNFIYTKQVTDYMIWNRLMEFANPGYNARVRRNQRNAGQRPLTEMFR